MTPKLLNDDTWDLGLYQGWYTKEQYDIDTVEFGQSMVYVFYQSFFPFHREDVRDFKITPEVEARLAAAFATEDVGADMSLFSMEDEAVYHYYKDNLASYAEEDYRGMLKDITVPALIVYADPGSIYDERTALYLAEHIAGAERLKFENAVHSDPVLTRAPEFADAITVFVNK
jgi:pimeloyl-ACP methyl ester carboxylesterase